MDTAETTASSLGLTRLLLSIQQTRTGLAAGGAKARTNDEERSSTPAVLHREGEFWRVGYEGSTSYLRDTKGLHFLVHLLRNPHREIHALDLTELVNGRDAEIGARLAPNDGVEMLDRAARASYRARVLDLQAEIAEARRSADAVRATRAQEELDFVTRELKRSGQLGGGYRRTGSDAERARLNVTRALHAAVGRIASQHPALADHLRHAVKTGLFCCYRPDSRSTVSWAL